MMIIRTIFFLSLFKGALFATTLFDQGSELISGYSAGFKQTPSQRFSCHADYLYLRGSQDNLSIDWDGGVRVALNYELPWDGWEASGRWTHFRTDKSSSLHTNWLDMEVGRSIDCTPKFSLYPSAGVRVMQSHKSYHSENSRFLTSFIGMGAKGRIDSTFSLGGGVDFYGGVGGSLLYGHFNMRNIEQNSGRCFDQVHSFDYQTGVRWAKQLFCDGGWLSLQAGWEGHLFIHKPPMLSGLDLQGFIFGLSLTI